MSPVHIVEQWSEELLILMVTKAMERQKREADAQKAASGDLQTGDRVGLSEFMLFLQS